MGREKTHQTLNGDWQKSVFQLMHTPTQQLLHFVTITWIMICSGVITMQRMAITEHIRTGGYVDEESVAP